MVERTIHFRSFVAYLLLITCRVVALLRAASRALHIYRGAREKRLSSDLELVVERCEETLNVQNARVLFSNEVASPVAIGRVIILPEALWASTSNELLTTAVGHEMAHVARHDFGWNVAISLLCAPICFHPATQLLALTVGRTREMSCDELVASHLLEPRTYACNLTALAAAMFPRPEASYSLGIFDGNALEARIHNLLGEPRLNRLPRFAVLAAFVALAVCVLLSIGFSLHANAAASIAPEEQAVTEFTPPPPPPEAPAPPPGWKGTLPPPPLVGTMPPMPEVAQTGASGLVQLSVAIAKDGSVQSVEAIQGPAPLIPPLARAVRKLMFQPTIVNGVPVEVTTMLTFRILPRP